MAARREIRELDLVEYGRCLYRSPERVPYVLPADVMTAEATAKKLILKTFAEEWVPDIQVVRRVYDETWNEVVGHDPELKTPPRAGLTVTRRIRDLLSRFIIRQPVTKYVLNLGRAAISGEYAVVSDESRGRRFPGVFVVRLRHRYERFERSPVPQRPDVVNYARWLNLRNMESHEPNIGVVNLGLDSDEVWFDQIPNERQVRGSLSYLVESIVSEQGFPSAGPYCSNCHTNGCQSNFVEIGR